MPWDARDAKRGLAPLIPKWDDMGAPVERQSLATQPLDAEAPDSADPRARSTPGPKSTP